MFIAVLSWITDLVTFHFTEGYKARYLMGGVILFLEYYFRGDLSYCLVTLKSWLLSSTFIDIEEVSYFFKKPCGI